MNGSFSFYDGLIASLFSMLVVFLSLGLLAIIISFFSKITPQQLTSEPLANHEDDLLVIKILASILAQEEGQPQNVVIRTIKRIE